MNKEILKHYYEEGKKFGYALARGATDLPSVQTFDELYTAQLQQHGVGGPASASVSGGGEQLGNEAGATKPVRLVCEHPKEFIEDDVTMGVSIVVCKKCGEVL